MNTLGDTLWRMVSITLLGAATGTLAALAAIGFVDLVATLNDWLFISPRSRFMVENAEWLVIATIAVPAAGGLIVGIIHRYIPDRRSHGPADIIRTVQGLEPGMPLRSGFLSAAASMVSLGAGASVGQYGPLAHLGATLGSLVAGCARNTRWMQTVGVGCGVAAAISTAFNAPIAGIIFAHEVILRHYSLRAFAPITVAATVGYVFANMVFERPPLFQLETVDASSAPEYVGFVAIGICGAFVAVIYMRAIFCSAQLARKVPMPDCLKPMLAGAALGLAALWIPDILGLGKETLRFAVIDQAFGAGELLVLVVAKILATALCLGFGFAGGVLSPALLIGILFGALAGNGAETILGEVHSEMAVYAVCGMVAVTSAVIGAPLTTILIVFELTRNYDLATAAMVSVVFSNLVAYRIFGRSMFDVQLRMRGFDLTGGRHKAVLGQRRLADHVSPDYTALLPETTIEEARLRLLEAGRHEACVVDANGVYLSTVTLAGLEPKMADDDGAREVTVAQLARPRPVILTAGMTLWDAMEQMGDVVGESIPVVEAEDTGRLLGVVFEATVVKACLDTTNRIREDENAAG